MKNFLVAIFISSMLFNVNVASAAPAKSRVSILKYYYCLANFLVVDKSTCHL